MTTIGITHDLTRARTIYADVDLDRLRAVAEVHFLGAVDPQSPPAALAACDFLSGGWGFPRLTPELLAQAPRLKGVCYAAGSIKGFATPEAYARGLTITSAMAANALPVADVTAALVVLASKNWFRVQDLIRAHGAAGWQLARNHFNEPRQAECPEPPMLGTYGLTVGMIGFGSIARLTAARLQHLEPRILVYDPYASEQALAEAGAERVPLLTDLARRSDVITVHAPDIPATHHMCNEAFFQAMRPGTSFINTARGRLVDEAALIQALTSGRIQAFLDVTHPEPPAADSPLYRLPNCWLTPHRAGSHGREVHRMGRLAVEDLLRLIAGVAPQHAIHEAQLATMA